MGDHRIYACPNCHVLLANPTIIERGRTVDDLMTKGKRTYIEKFMYCPLCKTEQEVRGEMDL